MESMEILRALLNEISSIEAVQSIGISGRNIEIPQVGEGDIDIFVYCKSIPDEMKRQTVMSRLSDRLGEIKIGVFEGGHWGVGDFTLINGVETWLMYFSTDENDRYVDDVLKGMHLNKVNNYFYPVGRCAMLRGINIMLDKEKYLENLKRRLEIYPEDLKTLTIQHYMEKLSDVEDLERAVGRKDVLFYHFALDIAMDHFLQALFAVNRTYFPSRKRSLEYIDRFAKKPAYCGERLLEIIRLGGKADCIEDSYRKWTDLVSGLQECIVED